MSVSFVNALQVPTGQEARFLLMWERGATYVSQQPGFIWTTLHRNMAANGLYQYYTVACWESQSAFQAATSTDWWKTYVQEFGFRDPESGLRAVPAVCEVVSESTRVFRRNP